MVATRDRRAVHQARAISIVTSFEAVSVDNSYIEDPKTLLHDHESEPAARYVGKLPAHYILPPTVPLPFEGTLEASLDALLELQRSVPELLPMVTALIERKKETDWPALFCAVLALKQSNVQNPKGNTKTKDIVSYIRKRTKGRYLLTTLLFLITRRLLPNQILENRNYMTRLYSERRGTYVRLLLRYDMLLAWKKDGNHYLAVPAEPSPGIPPLPVWNKDELRQPLYPNIWASLLAPPKEGFVTKSVGEKLRHHITELDGHLLMEDREAEGWGDKELILRLASVVGLWLWVREMNQKFDDMEIYGWEGLADPVDNDWFLDNLNQTNA